MRIVFLLLAFLLFISSAHATEQTQKPKALQKKTFCQAAKDFKPRIKVHIDWQEIQYDFSKSRDFLTNNRKEAMAEWQSKQEDAVWATADLVTNGIARGGVGVETRAKFIAKPYDKYGTYYCPYIETLEVKFYYKTTIFVASDYKKGTCKFNATLEHEKMHHDANVKAVQDVVAKFKKDLPKMISYLERKYVKKQEVQNKFSTMNESVHDAFEIYADVITEEMEKQNAPIDTAEEYTRVRELCPQ